MKSTTYALLISSAFMLSNCGETTPKVEEPAKTAVEETTQEEEIDAKAISAEILTKRKSIEEGITEPTEILTAELREKIKQKWSKIHFYAKDGQVVRIKTYPYAEITKRTEEFYLEDGQLILAVIQDKEETNRGVSEDEMDKMYFYHNGELIKETKNTEEEEYSIKESDGEELLQEVNEYLNLYKKK